MAEQIPSPESSSTNVSACRSPTEVPRVDETSGPGAGTFQGTDVLERFIESVVVEHLRKIAAKWPNYSWERIVEDLDVENALSKAFSNNLGDIAGKVAYNLLQQLPETSSNLSLKDLKVFCVPLCWSSTKRVHFWSSFSDMLEDMGHNPPNALISKLESQGPLLFDGKGIDEIAGEWINTIDPKYKPRKYDDKSVRGLLRFVRNRWHHLDGFQEIHKLRSAESFCNYLHKLFPSLLRVSYGVAYQFCREETWFKEFCSSETFAGVPSEVMCCDPSASHFP